MNTEQIKIVSALSFFFATLAVITVMTYKAKMSGKLYATLIMGMVGVMAVILGVVIDWKNLKPAPVDSIGAGARPAYAYGLKIKRIAWVHRYLDHYGFQGSIEYDAENATATQIVELPPEKTGWFGWDSTIRRKPTVRGSSGEFYTLQDQYVLEKKIIRRELDGSEKKVTQIFWQYRVDPPIAPGKMIKYGTEFETGNTEREAYTESGSFAGMSTPYPASTLGCELYAPSGYRFENRGFIVRDRAGHEIEYRASSPDFEGKGKKITWTVDDPVPNVQYFIKVRLVKGD